jgi:cytochrome c
MIRRLLHAFRPGVTIGMRLCAGAFLCLTSPANAIDTFTAHGGPIKGVTIGVNQEYMATASFDYSTVLWSVSEMKEIASLIGHDAAVNTAEFSQDGRWLATGGDDHQILLWRLDKITHLDANHEPLILKGHKGKVVDLNFSQDGSRLASASWDGSIGIWNLDDLEKFKFITGHEGPVNAIEFANDGEHIYSAGYDGHIRYWKLSNGEFLRSYVRNGWGVNVMKVLEDRNMLAYGTTDGAMKVIALDTREELLSLGEDRAPVLSLHMNTDTGQIAFGNAKGRVMIVDTSTWTLLRDFRAAEGPVWGLLLMPDDGSLVVVGLDDHVTRWRINDYPPEFLSEKAGERRFHPPKNLSNGERQFARKCSVCHTLVADGKRRAGPTLFGVFGRRAGSLEGYPYSDALINSSIIWNEETIDVLFRDGPDKVTPGTKMPIQRMKRKEDRVDLINFLKQATLQQ